MNTLLFAVTAFFAVTARSGFPSWLRSPTATAEPWLTDTLWTGAEKAPWPRAREDVNAAGGQYRQIVAAVAVEVGPGQGSGPVQHEVALRPRASHRPLPSRTATSPVWTFSFIPWPAVTTSITPVAVNIAHGHRHRRQPRDEDPRTAERAVAVAQHDIHGVQVVHVADGHEILEPVAVEVGDRDRHLAAGVGTGERLEPPVRVAQQDAHAPRKSRTSPRGPGRRRG